MSRKSNINNPRINTDAIISKVFKIFCVSIIFHILKKVSRDIEHKI